MTRAASATSASSTVASSVPLRTLLVEQPEDAAEPTGYWMSNLPASTPIADLVRWAKMRWRIEHD